jgi:hypothetical protein
MVSATGGFGGGFAGGGGFGHGGVQGVEGANDRGSMGFGGRSDRTDNSNRDSFFDRQRRREREQRRSTDLSGFRPGANPELGPSGGELPTARQEQAEAIDRAMGGVCSRRSCDGAGAHSAQRWPGARHCRGDRPRPGDGRMGHQGDVSAGQPVGRDAARHGLHSGGSGIECVRAVLGGFGRDQCPWSKEHDGQGRQHVAGRRSRLPTDHRHGQPGQCPSGRRANVERGRPDGARLHVAP